jgi:hypothetical protein
MIALSNMLPTIVTAAPAIAPTAVAAVDATASGTGSYDGQSYNRENSQNARAATTASRRRGDYE